MFVEAIKLNILDRVYYPDVMIACGNAGEVELIVEEPSLVVEVTSLPRAAIDEGVTLAPLRMREGEDWDTDEWVEVEAD